MKTVYTTGEAAAICSVSQQTIIRCFDNGHVKGFRVPGSRFRRIPREALMAFMKEHGIPLDKLDTARHKVLVIGTPHDAVKALMGLLEREGSYEVRTVDGGYEAGIATQELRPDLVILGGGAESLAICRSIRRNEAFKNTRVLSVGNMTQEKIDELLHAGADEHVKESISPDKLLARVQHLLP